LALYRAAEVHQDPVPFDPAGDLHGAAARAKGVQSVVDQIHEDLLHLGWRDPKGREVAGQVRRKADMRVVDSLRAVLDDLFEKVVELNLFDLGVCPAGEAEQVLGDFLAASPLGLDLLEGPAEFLEVWAFLERLFVEKILDPARLFHHDGNRVVDLVGDAAGPFRQRAHPGRVENIVDLSLGWSGGVPIHAGGIRGLGCDPGHSACGHHPPGEKPGQEHHEQAAGRQKAERQGPEKPRS